MPNPRPLAGALPERNAVSTVVRKTPPRPLRMRLAWAFTRYACIFPLLQFFVWLPLQWTRADAERDTVAYYHAARMTWEGRSMYEPLPPDRPHHPDDSIFLYPPPLGAALSLLPAMSFQAFARGWTIVLLSAYWLWALALARIWTGRVALMPTLVAGAIMGFVPGVMAAMGLGQFDVVMWAAIGLALAFPSLRGFALMMATVTKVFTVWALGVTLVRERSSRGAALAGIFALLVCTAALGWGGTVSASLVWTREVMPSLSQGQLAPTDGSAVLRIAGRSIVLPKLLPENLSLPYAPIVASERAGLWTYRGEALPDWVRLYLIVAGIGVPLVGIYLTRRRPAVQQVAIAVILAAIAGPIFRLTYVPGLLAPALVLYLRRTS